MRLCAATVLLGGCYDPNALVEARRESVVLGQLDEIDLGTFRIALPQPSATLESAEIHFRAFGKVSNRELERSREQFEAQRPELEHRVLLAIRSLEKTQFEDPKLTALRKVVADTVNEQLEGTPLQAVGFYSFGFSNYH